MQFHRVKCPKCGAPLEFAGRGEMPRLKIYEACPSCASLLVANHRLMSPAVVGVQAFILGALVLSLESVFFLTAYLVFEYLLVVIYRPLSIASEADIQGFQRRRYFSKKGVAIRVILICSALVLAAYADFARLQI